MSKKQRMIGFCKCVFNFHLQINSAVNDLLSVTGWVVCTTIALQCVAVFHKCTSSFDIAYMYVKMNIIMFAVLFLYGFYGIELAVKILNLSLAEFYIHVHQIVLTSSSVLRHPLERTGCLSSYRYFTKKYLSGRNNPQNGIVK